MDLRDIEHAAPIVSAQDMNMKCAIWDWALGFHLGQGQKLRVCDPDFNEIQSCTFPVQSVAESPKIASACGLHMPPISSPLNISKHSVEK